MSTILDNVGVNKCIKVYRTELLNETHERTITTSLKSFTTDNQSHIDEDEEGEYVLFLYDASIPLKVIKNALKNTGLIYDEYHQKKKTKV